MNREHARFLTWGVLQSAMSHGQDVHATDQIPATPLDQGGQEVHISPLVEGSSANFGEPVKRCPPVWLCLSKAHTHRIRETEDPE
jgi:hypothetical protein